MMTGRKSSRLDAGLRHCTPRLKRVRPKSARIVLRTIGRQYSTVSNISPSPKTTCAASWWPHCGRVVSERSTREARIVAIGIDRSRRIPAPDSSRPTGRWLSITEAMNALLAPRAHTLAFVERFDGDLRGWRLYPIAGVVNGYEMLLMIAVHPLRHAPQIDEIRARLVGDDQ
jgi:hypothetical protein